MEQCKLDSANPDERLSETITDKIIEHANELYDNEKEGGDARNTESFKPVKRPAEADTVEEKESGENKKLRIDE